MEKWKNVIIVCLLFKSLSKESLCNKIRYQQIINLSTVADHKSTSMFKNYFKNAWRNILRSKGLIKGHTELLVLSEGFEALASPMDAYYNVFVLIRF